MALQRVIAVTGAFGILGAAVAETLAGDGIAVALIDRAPAPPAAVPAGAQVHGGIELADEAACAQVMQRIARSAGRLDGVVNLAGGFVFEKIDGGSLATWETMLRGNLLSAVAASGAALPYLAAGGRIVNVGAAGALKAAAGMGAYAASKAGVAKLTEALADELKDRGITVNAVLPGTMDTPRNRHDMPGADFSRWVPPLAVADVIAFLVSDAAHAVTGALIPVMGRT